jgi:hypothetical protein
LLRSGAEPAGLVPNAVADLLSAIRAFAPPIVLGRDEVDVYRLRAKLIDLCWSSRVDPHTVDLHALIDAALSPDAHGARIRGSIASGVMTLDELTSARAAGL